MMNNSEERRKNVDRKTVLVDDVPDGRPESQNHHAETDPADEAAVIEKTPAAASGVVTDCLRLNVRSKPSPDGEVLAVLDAFSEVVVDSGSSTGAFCKIRTAAGVEGFCMKKYIALQR